MGKKDDMIPAELAWDLIQFTQSQLGGELLDDCKTIDEYIKCFEIKLFIDCTSNGFKLN